MVSGIAWEVWYRDTFDRECPPSVEARGTGLVGGLTELWARHLFETVRPDGGQGFSRFHLWCEPARSVQITGPWPGATRLRQWVFGEQRHTARGYVGAGDGRLLARIAATHASLLQAGRSSDEILRAAAQAQDRRDFEARLLTLRKGLAGSGGDL